MLCKRAKALNVIICNICNMPVNNRSVIDKRRQKPFGLLTRGMKGYEIARELKVNEATISRDIKYWL
jgi:DNA-binding NarL/FixJ family response regulator